MWITPLRKCESTGLCIELLFWHSRGRCYQAVNYRIGHHWFEFRSVWPEKRGLAIWPVVTCFCPLFSRYLSCLLIFFLFSCVQKSKVFKCFSLYPLLWWNKNNFVLHHNLRFLNFFWAAIPLFLIFFSPACHSSSVVTRRRKLLIKPIKFWTRLKLAFNIVFTVTWDETVKVLSWKPELQGEVEYSLPEPQPNAELSACLLERWSWGSKTRMMNLCCAWDGC